VHEVGNFRKDGSDVATSVRVSSSGRRRTSSFLYEQNTIGHMRYKTDNVFRQIKAMSGLSKNITEVLMLQYAALHCDSAVRVNIARRIVIKTALLLSINVIDQA
jgi:hypothetical protein